MVRSPSRPPRDLNKMGSENVNAPRASRAALQDRKDAA
jgi:hypothetical protein